VLCTDESVQNVNKAQRPMQEVHVSHVISSFWYQKNLVPERVAHDPSFWYEILVAVLGRRTWIMCHGPCR